MPIDWKKVQTPADVKLLVENVLMVRDIRLKKGSAQYAAVRRLLRE